MHSLRCLYLWTISGVLPIVWVEWGRPSNSLKLVPCEIASAPVHSLEALLCFLFLGLSNFLMDRPRAAAASPSVDFSLFFLWEYRAGLQLIFVMLPV
jgi:hypothetical protein